MARKVTINHAVVQQYLDGDHGVRELLMDRAERVLAAAEADASAYRETGRYMDGLGIQEERTDRLAVRIGSNAPHAHLVEAKHGTLARALDAAGGS